MICDCDVVVIGGGIQGLWLVDHLRTMVSHLNPVGLSVYLLEGGSVGGGQCAHAEGLIHRGSVYMDGSDSQRDYLKDLPTASLLWSQWAMQSAPIPTVPTYVCFDTTAVSNRLIFWNRFCGHVVREITPPADINSSAYEALYESDEFVIELGDIVPAVVQRCSTSILEIDSASMKFVLSSPRSVDQIDVQLRNGSALSLKPQLIAICGGASNSSIFQDLGLAPQPAGYHKKNECDLLVIQDPTGMILPKRNLLRADGDELLQVTRVLNGKTYWLATTRPCWHAKRGTLTLAATLQETWESLCHINSSLPVDGTGLGFSTYSGVLVAPNENGRTTRDGTQNLPVSGTLPENVVVLWPERLTLAPVQWNRVMSRFASLKPRNSSQIPSGTGVTRVAEPVFGNVQFQDWASFISGL